MPDANLQTALRSFKLVEEKDLDGLMVLYTKDATLSDPHYPNPHMQGHKQIAEGMKWGFDSLNKLGFNIIDSYTSTDGKSLVISVNTAHELPNGKPLCFPQLFVFTFEGQLIKSFDAYVQYGPHGGIGLMLTLTRIGKSLIDLKNKILRNG